MVFSFVERIDTMEAISYLKNEFIRVNFLEYFSLFSFYLPYIEHEVKSCSIETVNFSQEILEKKGRFHIAFWLNMSSKNYYVVFDFQQNKIVSCEVLSDFIDSWRYIPDTNIKMVFLPNGVVKLNKQDFQKGRKEELYYQNKEIISHKVWKGNTEFSLLSATYFDYDRGVILKKERICQDKNLHENHRLFFEKQFGEFLCTIEPMKSLPLGFCTDKDYMVSRNQFEHQCQSAYSRIKRGQ